MKPFDLQKALAGEPVQTRSGKKVTNVNESGITPSVIYFSSDLIDLTRNMKSKDGFVGDLTHFNEVPIKEDESLPKETIRLGFNEI